MAGGGERLSALRTDRKDGQAPAKTTPTTTALGRPLIDQAGMDAQNRLLRGAGPVARAGSACITCHPIPTVAEAAAARKKWVTGLVRAAALDLMEAHRGRLLASQKALEDRAHRERTPGAASESPVGEAVAAARAASELESKLEWLAQSERHLRWLAAEARRSLSFDEGWPARLRALLSPRFDSPNDLSTEKLSGDVRRLSDDEDGARGLFSWNVDGYVKRREAQQFELARNIGELYRRFPFFGTLPPRELTALADRETQQARLAQPEYGVGPTPLDQPVSGTTSEPLGSELNENLPTPPLSVTRDPLRDRIDQAYQELLDNIADVNERIRLNQIDPLTLPEAVALALERMDISAQLTLDELLQERNDQEDRAFLAGLALPLVLAPLPVLGEAVVIALGVSKATAAAVGSAFLIGDAALGGALLVQSTAEYLDRRSLEAASTRPDRSLLGVPPTSGTEKIMLIVDYALTAAGLAVALRTGAKGPRVGPRGVGSPATGTPAMPRVGPVQPGAMPSPGLSQLPPGPTKPPAAATKPPTLRLGSERPPPHPDGRTRFSSADPLPNMPAATDAPPMRTDAKAVPDWVPHPAEVPKLGKQRPTPAPAEARVGPPAAELPAPAEAEPDFLQFAQRGQSKSASQKRRQTPPTPEERLRRDVQREDLEGGLIPDPRARGGANESSFCSEKGLEQLGQSTATIDAYRPGTGKPSPPYTIQTSKGRKWQVTEIHGAEVTSIKSREVVIERDLGKTEALFRDYVEELAVYDGAAKPAYASATTQYRFINPSKKTLVIIFDEATVFPIAQGGEKAASQMMEALSEFARGKGVDLDWYVTKGGQRWSGRAFMK